ncbi:hypothetical protein CM15mP35_08790 [bacterium]|nr:MAG: hypothetical protein CM15mP35_08790 [bacterium]
MMEFKLLWIGILITMVNQNIKNIIFKDILYSSVFDLKNTNEGLDFLQVMIHFYKWEHGIIKKEKF